MKTVTEIIAVMTAYKEGKKIQIWSDDMNDWLDWTVYDDPKWDWSRYDFRIKPEPKYRPYANAEECFADVQKHGGWMRHKSADEYLFINRVSVRSSFEWLFESYVWADDGSPCGVKEE